MHVDDWTQQVQTNSVFEPVWRHLWTALHKLLSLRGDGRQYRPESIMLPQLSYAPLLALDQPLDHLGHQGGIGIGEGDP